MFRFAFALLATFSVSSAASSPPWTVVRSAHFDVYSESGEDAARCALGWFEQLRAFFFAQTNLDRQTHPVRVIGFSSPAHFHQYTSRTTADAFYVGTSTRDTIVMSGLTNNQFGVAAHEYAHVLLHAEEERLPSWLSEGLADFLSTVHIGAKASTVGGDFPERSRILARQPWMPLPDLFSVVSDDLGRGDRRSTGLFYAESWALAHMLVLSPRYNSRFPALIVALVSPGSGAQAFHDVYGKSLDVVAQDARAWVESHKSTVIALPGSAAPEVAAQASSTSPLAAGLMLAELLTDSGEFAHADALYQELEQTSKGNAEISAGRGAIALLRGDRDQARREWQHAIERGIEDPLLCYRFAMLAEDASMDPREIRPALERAIALRPDFDDARYALALLEMNAGRFQQAVDQFQAMKAIAPARAFHYWIGLAYSLNELEHRGEAKAASLQAAQFARTPQERARASELAYFAETDLTVRFTRDANGEPQLVTARSPHGQTDWNPFIEPGDRIRRVDATLREIVCDSKATRIVVSAEGDRLILVIPDPTRVQMRHAPLEFTCGPQSPRTVTVEYAIPEVKNGDGIVRGIDFR